MPAFHKHLHETVAGTKIEIDLDSRRLIMCFRASFSSGEKRGSKTFQNILLKYSPEIVQIVVKEYGLLSEESTTDD